ncbi:MAG: type I DNA topoisomerase [Deltaproteobacteria bacterium]|nr:type I DNA topoisomerase [Deltaproteobacteria bacterium]
MASTKPLVVVESPTKVRTIKKYLGNEYNVAATVGHIKDLPPKEIGIDIESGFKPKYRTIPGKKKVITSLKRSAEKAEDVYLAPDPDREGEAIAWHTADILKKKGRRFHRVLFHELTKTAIREAMASPEALNADKYEAQQARRILDRLVGYQVSPLLWRKVKGGLSAGRVQSVALRIICERERAIHAFDPVEYWSITAHLEAESPPPFTAKLVKEKGKKIQIPDEASATHILDELSGVPMVVDKVVKKTVKRNPLPPFTTSKLQQEAIRKLKFSAKKTMMVAQQLYEGIDLGPGEPIGLITYMRTDSTRISMESAQEALRWIKEKYGEDYSLPNPRFFKNRKKVQDAHEAIRPTSVYHTPDEVAPYLSNDQLRLYRMIWQRFVASQMKEALINQNSVAIKAGDYIFNASGSSVKFPGFMTVYMTVDDEIENEKRKDLLPDLVEGMILKLNQLDPKQHFTQPPPRFSEASLVKELEENGIGRPSTYAAILSTIREKGYVNFLKGYFRPSELGFIVNDLLVQNFPDIFNVEFTARMEESLDRIESSETAAIEVLSEFYDPFKKELNSAETGMLSMKGIGFPTGLNCPKCSKELSIKVGKNGPFLACSGYPECNYSRDYERDEKGNVQPIELPVDEESEITCDKCENPMVIKQGKYGKFLACSRYPDCKHTQSLNGNGSGEDTGVNCPLEDCDGNLIQKQSRRGKIFFGCSQFPRCNYATWDKPVPHPCSKCNAPFLVEKSTKKRGTYYTCLTKECDFQADSL